MSQIIYLEAIATHTGEKAIVKKEKNPKYTWKQTLKLYQDKRYKFVLDITPAMYLRELYIDEEFADVSESILHTGSGSSAVVDYYTYGMSPSSTGQRIGFPIRFGLSMSVYDQEVRNMHAYLQLKIYGRNDIKCQKGNLHTFKFENENFHNVGQPNIYVPMPHAL